MPIKLNSFSVPEAEDAQEKIGLLEDEEYEVTRSKVLVENDREIEIFHLSRQEQIVAFEKTWDEHE